MQNALLFFGDVLQHTIENPFKLVLRHSFAKKWFCFIKGQAEAHIIFSSPWLSFYQ